MNVRHGKLQNVYCRAVKHGGFTIVPADVELSGTMFRPSFRLNELPSDRIPPVLRRAVSARTITGRPPSRSARPRATKA
jgi:hypothetical protein